jgi:glycosyltransferase involved in cell wall biosynthesis
MEEIVADPAIHEKLSQLSLERSQLFTWETSSKKVWEIIEMTSHTKY